MEKAPQLRGLPLFGVYQGIFANPGHRVSAAREFLSRAFGKASTTDTDLHAPSFLIRDKVLQSGARINVTPYSDTGAGKR